MVRSYKVKLRNMKEEFEFNMFPFSRKITFSQTASKNYKLVCGSRRSSSGSSSRCCSNSSIKNQLSLSNQFALFSINKLVSIICNDCFINSIFLSLIDVWLKTKISKFLLIKGMELEIQMFS